MEYFLFMGLCCCSDSSELLLVCCTREDVLVVLSIFVNWKSSCLSTLDRFLWAMVIFLWISVWKLLSFCRFCRFKHLSLHTKNRSLSISVLLISMGTNLTLEILCTCFTWLFAMSLVGNSKLQKVHVKRFGTRSFGILTTSNVDSDCAKQKVHSIGLSAGHRFKWSWYEMPAGMTLSKK